MNSALLMETLRQEIRPPLAANKKLTLQERVLCDRQQLGRKQTDINLFFFMSIKKVRLPVVNENRFCSVSAHWIDSVVPEHVFLKVKAWKMGAGLRVIADLHMLILNPMAMANRLVDCGPQGHYGKMLTHMDWQ